MSDEKQLLRTIDAETLLSTPLEPVRFIVDGLLPPGAAPLGRQPQGRKKLAHAVAVLESRNR